MKPDEIIRLASSLQFTVTQPGLERLRIAVTQAEFDALGQFALGYDGGDTDSRQTRAICCKIPVIVEHWLATDEA